MSVNKSAGKLVSISIANLGLAIKLENLAYFNDLELMYRDYLAQPPLQLLITVLLAESIYEHSAQSTEVVFNDTSIVFLSRIYQGLVDFDRGDGLIVISSAHPIQAIDYLVRILYAVMGFRAGGILFHAAGIVHLGKAHIFFGHSGSGKSTVARISGADIVLNDDLVLLMPEGDDWMVHSTPFWNNTQVRPTANHAPLTCLYYLVKDQHSYLEEVSPALALTDMISCVPVIAGSPVFLNPLLKRCSNLLATIPAYHLHFAPDTSFWKVIDQNL